MNKISVIVCHHKGEKLLRKTLESLCRQSYKNYEILVATSVNDFRLDYPRTTFIEIQGGPAAKRNVAARYATGSFLAFYDDDIEADRDSLKDMASLFRDREVGMVFSKLMKMDEVTRFDEAGGYLTWTGFIWSRAEQNVRDEGQFNTPEPIFAGKSAACMIPKKVFYQVGMFDPKFYILGEESDLAWRVWLSDRKVMFCPQSTVLHAFNTRFKPIDYYTHERVYFNGCRNYLFMLASNLEPKNLVKILPIHMLAWLVAATGMLLRGKPRASYYILKGFFAFIFDLKHVSIKRAKVAQIRKLPDQELFRFIRRDPKLSYYLNRLFRYWKIGLHG